MQQGRQAGTGIGLSTIAIIAVGFMATGCTPTADVSVESPSASATAPASPPSADPVFVDPADIPRNTVVATATLAPPEGGADAGGQVVVRTTDTGDYLFELSGFHSDRPDFATTEAYRDLLLEPDPVAEIGDCLDTGLRLGIGQVTPAEDQSFNTRLSDFSQGDPTFFSTIAVTIGTKDRDDGCMVDVVAAGTLEWTMPDLRPDLIAADTGAAAGARGTARLSDAGILLDYTVAAGDVLAEIAARFGITVDDILYLNPERSAPGPARQAYTGEVLNLDKTDR